MKKKHIFIFLVLILLIILSIIYIIGFFSSKKEAIEESNLLNTYDNYIVEETSKEDENQMFQFIDIEKIDNYNLKPFILKDIIKNIDIKIKHFVNYE